MLVVCPGRGYTNGRRNSTRHDRVNGRRRDRCTVAVPIRRRATPQASQRLPGHLASHEERPAVRRAVLGSQLPSWHTRMRKVVALSSLCRYRRPCRTPFGPSGWTWQGASHLQVRRSSVRAVRTTGWVRRTRRARRVCCGSDGVSRARACFDADVAGVHLPLSPQC